MHRPGRGTTRRGAAVGLVCLLTTLLAVATGLAGVTAGQPARVMTPSRQTSSAHRYVDAAALAGRQVTVAPAHRRATAEGHEPGSPGPAVLPGVTAPVAGHVATVSDAIGGDVPVPATPGGADSRAPPA